MLVPMARAQIIGSRRYLDRVLEVLYGLGLVQIVDARDAPGLILPPLPPSSERARETEELRLLAARLDTMLRLEAPVPPDVAGEGPVPGREGTASFDLAAALPALRADLDRVAPLIEEILRRRDDLRAEGTALPRHARSVGRLLPFVPEIGELAGYETVALLIESRHAAVLGLLRSEVGALVGARFELVSARLDPETVGALLIVPRKMSRTVHALLSREHVSRLALPARFEGLPFREALRAMDERMAEIPRKMAALDQDLEGILGPRRAAWRSARKAIEASLARGAAVERVGTTDHTFVVNGWVPRGDLPRLAQAVEAVGPEVLVVGVPVERGEETSVPVLLRNPPPVRPFEALTRLLAVPRYGGLDPTPLLAFFFPLFFGAMVGDIAHGAILLAAALAVRRIAGRNSPWVRDLARVLGYGAAASIGFGLLYGEFLGDLGSRFGLRPLWLNREEATLPLFAAAIALGAGHVVLGLLLGVGVAARERQAGLAAERAGLAMAAAALFAFAARAAGVAPAGTGTAATGALVSGLALVAVALGPARCLLAPLEILGVAGNILSYLRLAAIGLASVYLSRVANELMATVPGGAGVVVAILLHALNVALAAFTPAIQALRLNYVEFFGKFFEGGGEPFAPFGGR